MFLKKNRRAGGVNVSSKIFMNMEDEEVIESEIDIGLLKHNQNCIIGK
ncbi:MAG: hypothetical protein GX201_06540 [Clostridiales bacterium]|jgi:hypothetical protein|nr:hypothetical protein [Clostridiales bacterium]